MIYSIDIKEFDEIQHLFNIKTFSKIGTELNTLSDKGYLPLANILLMVKY